MRLRYRKPLPVDKVRSGREDVDVFYDFGEHDFFFEKPGSRERVHAKTFTEVRRLLDQVYEGAAPLDWRPVILVTLHDAYDEQDHSIRTKKIEGACVSFTFRRCELSPRPDHAEQVERVRRERERDRYYGRASNDDGPIERVGFIEREHAIDFEARDPTEHDREVRERTLERPDTYDNDADVVELPYEEETWQGLCAMKAAVDELHGRLGALIGSSDFRDRLKRFKSGAWAPLLLGGRADKP